MIYYFGFYSLSTVLLTYRALAGFLFLFAPIYCGSSGGRLRSLLLPSLLLILSMLQMLLAATVDWFGIFRGAYKIVLPFIAASCVAWLVKEKFLNLRRLRALVYINSGVLAANLLLPYFDIGYANYRNGGSSELATGTGFFFAGNEATALFIATFGLMLALQPSRGLKKSSTLIVYGLAAISLGSKSAIASYVLFAVIAVALSKFLIIVSMLVLLPTMLAVSDYVAPLFLRALSVPLARWEHFSSEYGATTVLLGGASRLEHISYQLNEMLSEPLVLLFGRGWSGVAENNLIDLAYGYGVLGLSIFLIWVLAGPLIWLKYQPTVSPRVLLPVSAALTLLAGVALIAGHVVQSSSLSVIWALLLSTPAVYRASSDARSKEVRFGGT